MSLLFINVGCSGGFPFPYSQYDGFNIVGFDISKSSIDSLRRSYPNNTYHHRLLDKISFECSGLSYHSLINKFASQPKSFYINYFKPSFIERVLCKLIRFTFRLLSKFYPQSLHAHLLRIES